MEINRHLRGNLIQDCLLGRSVLNGYLRYLPTLTNSPKAAATTKNGNVPFEEADLASIMLAALPLMWQNKYNLTHSIVP